MSHNDKHGKFVSGGQLQMSRFCDLDFKKGSVEKKKMFAVLPFALVIVFTGPNVLMAVEPRVENVRARQIKDTKDVEVTYDLIAPDGGLFDISVQFVAPNATPDPKSLSGDVGVSVEPGRNRRLVWDAGMDWPDNLNSNFTCTVTAEEREPDPSMGMVRIPGGTNTGTDPDFGPYSLTVDTFYMDRTEVTYAQWKRVYNWAIKHGYQFDHPGSGKGATHPVHTIDRYDAVKWCNARSEMENRKPVYLISDESVFRTGTSYSIFDSNGSGYRLPTYDEWEYAARGGSVGRRFPWGDIISHARANYSGHNYDCSYDLDWECHPAYNDGVKPYTAPVGSFAANAYGLYDMVGNVMEFSTDPWGGVYGAGCYGGCWSWPGYQCRIGYYSFADGAYNTYGFRCVRR